MSQGLQEAGVIVAALLGSAFLLTPSARARAAALLGALVVTPALLLTDIWDRPQFEPIKHRPALAVAGGAAILFGVIAAATLLRRRPEWLALGAVAVLPFRVPIASGGSTANLLVPLYGVIAAGGVAYLWPRLRGTIEGPPRRARGALEWLLAGAVVLYAVQSTYSDDFTKALENLVFFYIPFLVLYGLLVELDWTPKLLRRSLGILAVLAIALCGIGFVEYATKQVLLNPQVIASNQFQSYFRVNSLFFDPNIFGRFLVIVMLLATAAMLWVRRPSRVWLIAATLGVLWAGLLLTLSQSSFGALLLGLVVIAALRFSAGWTGAVTGIVIATAAIVVLAFPHSVRLDLGSNKGVDKATSGRVELIKGGLRLLRDRPVAGYGAGSFSVRYRKAEHVSSERAVDASHTIPITVGAEQGAIGLALYIALLVVALLRLLRGTRTDPARTAVVAAFTALVLHTWLYAAFLEDPLTWALLAVGTALAVPARAESISGVPLDAERAAIGDVPEVSLPA
jgi:O-antigen ligase